MKWLKALCPVGLLLAGCIGSGSETTNTNLAGSASETNNGVVGFVHNAAERPIYGAEVQLFPRNLVPVHDSTRPLAVTYSGDYGLFSFFLEDTGTFNLVITDPALKKSAFVQDISTHLDSIVNSGRHVLKSPGFLAGTVVDSPALRPLVGANVFVQGSPFFTKTDGSGSFLFRDIPGAYYALSVEHKNPQAGFPTGAIAGVAFFTAREQFQVLVFSADTARAGLLPVRFQNLSGR